MLNDRGFGEVNCVSVNFNFYRLAQRLQFHSELIRIDEWWQKRGCINKSFINAPFLLILSGILVIMKTLHPSVFQIQITG